MFVYRRIRDLREDNDKTQAQIAKMLNMQLTVYQRYERGEREIPFWVAIKLADYYKVSLDYIAERSCDNQEKKSQKRNANLEPTGYTPCEPQ